jgi:hypothetical protein
MAWEGERTVTFTMEDALISPAGFMILSGAGLIESTEDAPLKVHVAEQSDAVYQDAQSVATAYVITKKPVSTNAKIYVMTMKDGEIDSEPYIATPVSSATVSVYDSDTTGTPNQKAVNSAKSEGRLIQITKNTKEGEKYDPDLSRFADTDEMVVMIDYYTEVKSGAQQIEITPDKFGGSYYLEASTLFRDTNGVDMPAEFIIPHCKIQSNFTFTMASTGDPSTFTFTMDAFPDYTFFNKTKKVLAAIQIINEDSTEDKTTRKATDWNYISQTTTTGN